MTCLLPDLLQTDRLILRAPRKDDARVLFDTYTQDSEVAHYMIWRPHVTVSQTEEFIAECLQGWAGGLRRPYILAFLHSADEAIGMLDARILSHIVEIGYVLARRYWGAGLMPEAVCALAEAALALPNFFRVQATCDIANVASARTLEKSGFVREARLERYTVLPNIAAEPRPSFMYARCR